MKKQILTILGVCYVCFALTLAQSSAVNSLNRTSSTQRNQNYLEQEDNGGDRYSQRLPRPPRTPEVERHFGWRPEYTDTQAGTQATEKAVTPIFQPNCMILWTAEWCLACKSMYPIVKILQAEGYTVYTLDYDKNKKLAKKMRIQSLPTTLIRRDGVEVTRRVGSVTLDEIKKTLTKN